MTLQELEHTAPITDERLSPDVLELANEFENLLEGSEQAPGPVAMVRWGERVITDQPKYINIGKNPNNGRPVTVKVENLVAGMVAFAVGGSANPFRPESLLDYAGEIGALRFHEADDRQRDAVLKLVQQVWGRQAMIIALTDKS